MDDLVLLKRPDAALKSAIAETRRNPLTFNSLWELAACLERSWRFREAEECLRLALKMREREVDAFLALGRVRGKLGLARASDRAYRSAFGAGPSDPRTHLQLARLAERRGRYRRAEAHVRRAVALSGRSARACRALAELLKGRGRWREAASWLKAAHGGKTSPALDFELGWLAMNEGRVDLMRRRFRRSLAGSKPTDDPLTRFLALLLLRDYRGAAAAAEAYLSMPDRRDFERFIQGWVKDLPDMRGDGRHLSDMASLDRWAQEEPASPWPVFIKGFLYWFMSRREDAISQWDRLQGLPERGFVWMRYFPGLLRHQLRRYEEARRDLEAAARSVDGFWQAHGYWGEALLCLGREREAFEPFDLVAIEGLRADHCAWRGEMLLWIGRYGDALPWLDVACESGSWTAPCWRGAAHMLLGNRAAAMKDFDAAIRAGDREGYVWRGELNRRMGKTARARRDLLRADRARPGEWVSINLGLLCAAQGDRAGMRLQFGRIDAEVVALIEKDLGLAPAKKRTDDEMRRIMEAGLERARGVRRYEPHMRDVWMR